MLCPVAHLSGAWKTCKLHLSGVLDSWGNLSKLWRDLTHIPTLTLFKQVWTTNGFCFHSSHFSTHYLAYLYVLNSNLAFWQVAFWQLLIPHLSPALCQKKGNPSFGEKKSEAFSGRWVRSSMFDLLQYLQKDSQMQECLSVSEGVSTHLPSVRSNRLEKLHPGITTILQTFILLNFIQI